MIVSGTLEKLMQFIFTQYYTAIMWRLYFVLTPPNIFVGFGDKDLYSTSWL